MCRIRHAIEYCYIWTRSTASNFPRVYAQIADLPLELSKIIGNKRFTSDSRPASLESASEAHDSRHCQDDETGEWRSPPLIHLTSWLIRHSGQLSLLAVLAKHKNTHTYRYIVHPRYFSINNKKLSYRRETARQLRMSTLIGWLTMHRTRQNRRGCTISDIQTL